MASSQTTSRTTSGPQTNGFSDYIPEFLKEAGVRKGRWYQSSKARPERLMEISLTADAQKVHACLELGSMAYQREDAVYTVKDGSNRGKQVWLTPGRISKLTGISKEHVLRALKELEYYGLAERFLIDPARGEVKGNVGVRSWAIPRPVQEGEKREPRAAPFLDLGDEYKPLARFVSRFKLDIDPDKWGDSRGSNLQAALEAVAMVEKAEKAAIALLKGFGAQHAHNKDEINGNYTEENKEAGRQADTVVVESHGLPACPSPVQNNHPEPNAPDPVEHPKIATVEQIKALPAIQELQEQLHDTVGDDLAAQVAANLRDAPLDDLNFALRVKAKTTRSLARAPSIAADVARANDARKQRSQKANEKSARQQQEQRARLIEDLKRNPNGLSESDRQLLEELKE